MLTFLVEVLKSGIMDATHYDPSRLVQARELRGESQQQIADALKVDRMTIYRAEQGKSISYELLAKMCAYYSMPVTSIIYPTPILATA
jgi:transcriptional regulator with XRE-family HTH domain